jgi:hypothetical protein
MSSAEIILFSGLNLRKGLFAPMGAFVPGFAFDALLRIPCMIKLPYIFIGLRAFIRDHLTLLTKDVRLRAIITVFGQF